MDFLILYYMLYVLSFKDDRLILLINVGWGSLSSGQTVVGLDRKVWDLIREKFCKFIFHFICYVYTLDIVVI